jgi:hypothetical protein
MFKQTIYLNDELFKNVKLNILDNPVANLEVPENWESVTEFGVWWVQAGMPIRFPVGAEVFRTDDATAVSLFRHGQFQIELYLIHPHPQLQDHEHPGVEVIKVRMGNNNETVGFTDALADGKSHGAGVRLEAETIGFPLIAIQHWKTREPITIAAMWKGKTVGPMQENLIRRFHPDAYVIDGYADITRKMTDV